ncbi:MAG: hypothetical protein IJH32_00160 [Ruminococcus sp.]|nr:hypothetical protein [Ruminococcus sp.]
MNAKELYLFKYQDGSRQTLRLRDLEYQNPYSLTNIFTELKDSNDEKDLLERLRCIIKGNITLAEAKGNKVSYKIITETLGKTVLRIRLKKGVADG